MDVWQIPVVISAGLAGWCLITLIRYLQRIGPPTCPSPPNLPPLPERLKYKGIIIDLSWLASFCTRLSTCVACIWRVILRVAKFLSSFCVRWRPVAEATGRDTIEVRWKPPPLKDWIASKRRRSNARVTPFDDEAGDGRWFELTDSSESLEEDGGKRMMKVAVEASSGGAKASVTGLKPGSTHQFCVLAKDEPGGRSKMSLISRSVQLPRVQQPSPLRVRPLSGTKIFVEWVEPQVEATVIGRYELSIRPLGDEKGWRPPAVLVASPLGVAPPLNTRRGGDDDTSASRAIVPRVDASFTSKSARDKPSLQDRLLSRLRGKRATRASELVAAASKLSCNVDGVLSEEAEMLPLQPGKGYYVRLRVWAEVSRQPLECALSICMTSHCSDQPHAAELESHSLRTCTCMRSYVRLGRYLGTRNGLTRRRWCYLRLSSLRRPLASPPARIASSCGGHGRRLRCARRLRAQHCSAPHRHRCRHPAHHLAHQRKTRRRHPCRRRRSILQRHQCHLLPIEMRPPQTS